MKKDSQQHVYLPEKQHLDSQQAYALYSYRGRSRNTAFLRNRIGIAVYSAPTCSHCAIVPVRVALQRCIPPENEGTRRGQRSTFSHQVDQNCRANKMLRVHWFLF